MTRRTRTSCNGCGRVLCDDERAVAVQLTDAGCLMSSVDAMHPKKRTYRWRSVGWDFCADCARQVYDAVSAIGKPDHDSLSEVLP